MVVLLQRQGTHNVNTHYCLHYHNWLLFDIDGMNLLIPFLTYTPQRVMTRSVMTADGNERDTSHMYRMSLKLRAAPHISPAMTGRGDRVRRPKYTLGLYDPALFRCGDYMLTSIMKTLMHECPDQWVIKAQDGIFNSRFSAHPTDPNTWIGCAEKGYREDVEVRRRSLSFQADLTAAFPFGSGAPVGIKHNTPLKTIG